MIVLPHEELVNLTSLNWTICPIYSVFFQNVKGGGHIQEQSPQLQYNRSPVVNPQELLTQTHWCQ